MLKHEVIKRIDALQGEVKKLSTTSPKEAFSKEIAEFYNTIKAFSALSVHAPYPDNFDTDYNDDYRFYSESSCREAAGNRRNRAYEDGRYFIEHLSKEFNSDYLKCLQALLTDWKRNLLDIYDDNGLPYPNKSLKIKVGDSVVSTSLHDHSDVPLANDHSIEKYFDEQISFDARWGNINGIKYVSEYDCEINTHYDCDIKETLFGNIKEVNKRYGYDLNLYTFQTSAWEVSKACGEKLAASDFMKNYIEDIKRSFLSEVCEATGYKNN